MSENEDNRDWICKEIGHDWHEVERVVREVDGEHIAMGYYARETVVHYFEQCRRCDERRSRKVDSRDRPVDGPYLDH